jgi:hypothetical protein
MPIPGPGPAISIQTIVDEFGGIAPHSLNEYYRSGGLVPDIPANSAIPTSGIIAIGNFYGSSSRITVNLTIAANEYNYDIFTNRSPAYVAGATDLIVTVNPGVTVGSTATPTYAMLVPSGFSPTDNVTIVNNGTIISAGGVGGTGARWLGPGVPNASMSPGDPGTVGGNGLFVDRPVTIENNGTIAGGGGGGGGGGGAHYPAPPKATSRVTGGGGGGGGAGFDAGGGGSGGQSRNVTAPASPGSPGTLTAGGAGGVGALSPAPTVFGGTGGVGGGQGAAGTAGNNATGPNPATQFPAGAGGAEGFYIVGNPFVTWTTTGTRLGGVG